MFSTCLEKLLLRDPVFAIQKDDKGQWTLTEKLVISLAFFGCRVLNGLFLMILRGLNSLGLYPRQRAGLEAGS